MIKIIDGCKYTCVSWYSTKVAAKGSAKVFRKRYRERSFRVEECKGRKYTVNENTKGFGIFMYPNI